MKANRQNTYNMRKHPNAKQFPQPNSRQLRFSVSKEQRSQQHTLASLFNCHSQNQIILRCCQNIEIIMDKKERCLYDSTKLQQHSQVCLNVGSGIRNMLKQCFEFYKTNTELQYLFSAVQSDHCLQTETNRNTKAKLHFSKEESGIDKRSVRQQRQQNITILNISLDQSVQRQQNLRSVKFSIQKDGNKQSFSKAIQDYNKQNQKVNKNIEKTTTPQTVHLKTANEALVIDCIDDPKFSFATVRRKSLIAQQAPRKQKLVGAKDSYHLQTETSQDKPKQGLQPPREEISALLEINNHQSDIKHQENEVYSFIKPALEDTDNFTKKISGQQFNPTVQKIELSHLAAQHDKNMNDYVSITETKNEKSNESQFTVRYNFRLTDKKTRTEVVRISPLRFRTPLKIPAAAQQLAAKHLP